jgi:Beta-propeller repeat
MLRLFIAIACLSCVVTALTSDHAGNRKSISAIDAPLALRRSSSSHDFRVPFYFEPNVGQTAQRVRFLSRLGGFRLFLTPTGSVVKLDQPLPAHRRTIAKTSRMWRSIAHRSATVSFTFDGGNSSPRIEGLDRLSARVNYFIGNDPKKWHTRVPTYSRVRYRDVWPGVDVVYYGTEGALEYDFVVAPHAKADAIRLGVDGADASLDRDGNLVLKTGAGEITLRRPLIYQRSSDGTRQSIGGRFILARANRSGKSHSIVSVELSQYDRSRALVIDPQLVYSSYLGGSGGSSSIALGDGASDIDVDSSGNFYIAGFAYSTDFPTKSGIPSMSPDPGNLTGADTPVAFVAKFNPADNGADSLVYSTYLGGSGDSTSGGSDGDQAIGIAVDGSGDAYVVGSTFSADFPTKSAFQSKNKQKAPNVSVAFVTELDATGSELVYSTFLGGSDGDVGTRIALKPGCSSNCEAYVTGSTGSSDFPTQSAFEDSFEDTFGKSEAFVTVVAANGGSVVYSTYLGRTGTSTGGDTAEGIAIDALGNAYVTGVTFSSDFPVTNGFQMTSKAIQNGQGSGFAAFVAKLSPSLGGPGSLVWSSFLGGSVADAGADIALDSASPPHVFVTGATFSPDFPTTVGAFQRRSRAAARGGSSAFLTEIDNAGSAILYSTLLSGSGGKSNDGDGALDLAVDSQGHAYVFGAATSTDFPTTANACQRANRSTVPPSSGVPAFNTFVTELHPGAKAGNRQLVFSTYFGGSGVDFPGGIAIDSSRDIYITGSTASPDLPMTLKKSFQASLAATNEPGFLNAFVAELNPAEKCGRMLVTPAVVNFGRVGTATQPAKVIPIRVKNVGRDLLDVQISSGLDSPLSLQLDPQVIQLSPGKTATAKVQFSAPVPSTPGRFTGQSVFIRSDDAMHASRTIPVVAVAVPGKLFVRKTLAFGTVAGSKTLMLRVKNVGLGVLHGSTDTSRLIGTSFNPTGGGSFTLNRGETQKVSIEFKPTSRGLATGTIIVTTTDDPAHPMVTVTAVGRGR